MRHLFAGLMLVVALAACGDGTGPSDVIPEELAGTWLAAPACLPECGFTFAPVANPADSINVVVFGGITMEAILTRAGRFTLTARPGDIPPVTGSARVEGSTLVLREGGMTDTLDYTLVENRLTLRFRGEFAFDFNGDQVDEPATIRGVFVRQ